MKTKPTEREFAKKIEELEEINQWFRDAACHFGRKEGDAILGYIQYHLRHTIRYASHVAKGLFK